MQRTSSPLLRSTREPSTSPQLMPRCSVPTPETSTLTLRHSPLSLSRIRRRTPSTLTTSPGNSMPKKSGSSFKMFLIARLSPASSLSLFLKPKKDPSQSWWLTPTRILSSITTRTFSSNSTPHGVDTVKREYRLSFHQKAVMKVKLTCLFIVWLPSMRS